MKAPNTLRARRVVSPPALRARVKAGQQGFTLIEVMMAMAVLTMGAVGIFAMQAAAMRGNQQARETTMAGAIAQGWVELIKRDALMWNQGSTNETGTDIAETTFLSDVPAPTDEPVWFTPTAAASTDATYRYDHLGNPLIADGVNPTYCVNLRLQWVYPGQAVRADVRVWWPRRGDRNSTNAREFPNCGVGSEDDITTARTVSMVTASTVVRWTGLR